MIKPGLLTTEFWVTVATQVWSAVALVGGWDVNSATANAVIKAIALGAAAVSAGVYAYSRARLKASRPPGAVPVSTGV